MPFVIAGLTYSAIGVSIAFGFVCLAQGLYFIADMVEEHVVLAKRIIRYCIIGVLIAHALLFFLEELPWLELSVGVAAHLVYSMLLIQFPVVELTDLWFILSTMFAIGNHALWFRYFLLNWYSYGDMFGIFLLCVWLVPFWFFVSLSANESSLPFDHPAEAAGKKKRVNLPALIWRLLSKFLPMRQQTQKLL
ncbi:Protein SVP26 [Pelomyxa schiedti]|nr:Protein SVP26 [Pelomyxa schiedti]